MKTMYRLGKKGKFQVFKIWLSEDQRELKWTTGQEGGATNPNGRRIFPIGRRSVYEQGMMDMQSKIHAFRKKGYRDSKFEAEQCIGENILGEPVPVKCYDGRKVEGNLEGHWLIQPKLNGVRCAVKCWREDGELKMFAYTYGGVEIKSISHIYAQIKEIIQIDWHIISNKPIYLDGELYIHGWSLQKLNSLVKRFQKDSLLLQFHVFDIFARHWDGDCNYHAQWRNAIVNTFRETDGVKIVTTFYEHNPDPIEFRDYFAEQGYEGMVARHANMPYVIRGRPEDIIKFKKPKDGEAKVVGVHASRENWGILSVEWEGHSFTMSAPGTHWDKEQVLENASEYIGKYVKFEFFEVTDDGCPSQPVAICFRDIG